MHLLSTNYVEDIDCESKVFRYLFNKECTFIDKQNRTLLMYLCKYNP